MTPETLNTPCLILQSYLSFEYLAMQNRPVVYVSRITNLSDARYCAGMGVDFLGFVIDPADPDFVSPETYQQMAGWISGPATVVELGDGMLRSEEIRASFAAEYLHVTSGRLSGIPQDAWKLMVEVPYPDLQKSDQPWRDRSDVTHLIVTGVPVEPRVAFTARPSVLVTTRTLPVSVLDFLTTSGAAGMALQGSKEVSPGLKDYDHLAQVLEELNG